MQVILYYPGSSWALVRSLLLTLQARTLAVTEPHLKVSIYKELKSGWFLSHKARIFFSVPSPHWIRQSDLLPLYQQIKDFVPLSRYEEKALSGVCLSGSLPSSRHTPKGSVFRFLPCPQTLANTQEDPWRRTFYCIRRDFKPEAPMDSFLSCKPILSNIPS